MKSVKNIKFTCHRIIKNPDIAKQIVTDIIHSSKDLEEIIPQFEKFVKKFDQGDEIRTTLRNYAYRKEQLIKAVDKT